MNRIILLSFILFFGCAGIPSKKNSKVFENGLYKHKITIEVKDRENISFLGFNDISDKEMKMVALSPFGSTILSFTKSSHHEELFYDDKVIPVSKTQMRSILFALRGMYRLREDSCLSESECVYKMMSESVYIERVAKKVENIRFQKDDKIKINIKVISYEKNS